MDVATITAIAAVGGSLVGGLTSLATNLVSQRFSARRDREIAELGRREALYAEFGHSAAELMLDSVGNDLSDASRMVGLMTTVGRIRMISSDPVLRAAQSVVASIMASYQAAPSDVLQSLSGRSQGLITPLIAFSDACREELLLMKQRL